MFDLPNFTPSVPVSKDYKLADTFYRDLKEAIQDAQEALQSGEQLIVHYYDAAGSPIIVTGLGYHNPNLLYIYGTDAEQRKCTVLAHIYSVQLIMKVLKADTDNPKTAIGFRGSVQSQAPKADA